MTGQRRILNETAFSSMHQQQQHWQRRQQQQQQQHIHRKMWHSKIRQEADRVDLRENVATVPAAKMLGSFVLKAASTTSLPSQTRAPTVPACSIHRGTLDLSAPPATTTKSATCIWWYVDVKHVLGLSLPCAACNYAERV